MLKILVAEDDELGREWLCDELAEDGHEIAEAGNGDAAAEILRLRDDIDLLLTDIRMPGSIDGWQLGADAKLSHPYIRIIYVTGYNEALRKPQSHERMLHKPFLYRDVRRLLAELQL